jgi:hypothetical protein
VSEDQAKWQPVMLVKQRRLECACGILAIFVCLEEVIDYDGDTLFDYTAWCQDCFSKAQQEQEEMQ